jgi:uncharacterized protein YebE (UPF0316 family)
MKDIENANEYNKEDDVILFDKIVDVDSEEYRTSKDKKTAITSFWSKEVVKKKNARTFPYV